MSAENPVLFGNSQPSFLELIPFDLAGSVRANQEADIGAGLNEAAAEIAADGTCTDKHEFMANSYETRFSLTFYNSRN